MNRKEFIYYLMNKVVKPILYLVLLIIGLYFLKNAFTDKLGTERALIYAGLVIIAVLFIMSLLSLLFDSLWKKTPEKVKISVRKADTILTYALLPFLAYLIYIKWNSNKWGIIVFLAIFLIQYFKNKKQTKPI